MSSGPPSNEGSGGGDGDEGLGDCRELLIVAHEAPVLHDPGEGPFHHPPARDHGKARLTRGALDHLQVNMGPLLSPTHEPTGIPPVCIGKLDERKASPRALQHPFGSVPILDVGRMDLNREQASVGIGQDVALAPVDLLACVVALRSPF